MRHWTEAERAKQAELIKNWQPWRNSTGATTAHGKAKASRNALKHGAYSADMQEIMYALREQKQALHEVRDSRS
jgi:hypothetical protein